MRTLILGALVSVFTCVGIAKLEARQPDCSDCVPDRYSWVNPATNSLVCIDEDVPEPVQDDIEAGVNYWINILDQQNININITVVKGTSSNPCDSSGYDVLLYGAPISGSVGGIASPTANMHGSSVVFNSSKYQTLNSGEWRCLAAHEFGHLLGWKDIYESGCPSKTVMFGVLPTDCTLGDRCTDNAMVAWQWTGNWDDDEDWQPSQHEEDCWDVYLLTVSFWQDSQNNWHSAVIGRTFLGTDCGPPPI